MGPFIAYGCFCHLRIRFSKHCGDSLFIRRLAQCTIWQKIWSVEAVEMRDSASTRKRRDNFFAKVPLNCLPDKFAISLQNHRSCCPTTFSADMSCIQSMLFPKKNDEDYWLYGYHAKVTQHCKLSAKKILLISKTCSESSSDFFAPFISEIALKRIVHRLSNILFEPSNM